MQPAQTDARPIGRASPSLQMGWSLFGRAGVRLHLRLRHLLALDARALGGIEDELDMDAVRILDEKLVLLEVRHHAFAELDAEAEQALLVFGEALAAEGDVIDRAG